MSVSLVRSTTAAHPIILNGATTCNVTLNASEECTYALTDTIDGNKFNVNAAAVGDGSFTVTLSLKVAANKDTQIAYTVTLTATPVSGTNNPKSENITIYVSSSTTDVAGAVLSNVPTLTSSVNINEFDTTTKALWAVAQTNAVDQGDITVAWDGAAPTGYTLNSALVNGNIEINRSTNVDMADLTTNNGSYGTDTVNVILTYVDTAHNNNGVGSDKTYASVSQALIIPYTPVQIDFYESASLTTERESGNVVAAAGAVVTYYDGTEAGSDANCTVADQQSQVSATKIIPVFVNQKCTWTVTGGADSAKFGIYSDSAGSNAIGVTKTATAYVKFDPGAVIDFADQNEYNCIITITDGGYNGGTDATKSRTLAIKVAVTADTTNPVILQSDAAATGTFVDLAANAITKSIDEQAAAYDVMTFNLDVTKHGVNDPYASARYYLLADPTAAASGTAVSMQVTSKSGSNTMTFEITDTENNSNREAVLKVSAAGVSFDNNYSNTNDNVYEIGIFAADSATGTTNKSAVIKATITVKNTDALKYHGSASSTSSIVSTGVVQSGGTTNSSTVAFSIMSSMPIAALVGDASTKYDITLYDVTNAADVSTLISAVTNNENDVTHSNNTNIQVSKWTFTVQGMTTGTQYKLSLPALSPAASHQNVASSLAGSVITETTNNDFIFTFDLTSADILFNCAESIEWPRGQPYTEFHIDSNLTVSTTATENIGAKHTGTAGNSMSCFNGVDPRADAGTICFFTWTLTDANNNITSKTRTVTIREATHFGKDWRAPPNMSATFTHDLTFGGTNTAAQPAAMTYTQLKEDGATTTRSDGTALAVDRDTTFTATQLGTLWTYTGVNVTNATLNEYYSVNNEDVYAFNFGADSTHTQKTKDFGTAAGCTPIDAADKTGFVSLTGIGDAVANWDLAAGYLSTDLRGLRVITLRENTTGHNITVELANVNIDRAIQTAFTLFSAAQPALDTTLNIYDNAAPLTFKMNKADFNNIFFYKLDNDAYLTDANGTAGGTVWNNLPTSNTLRSEDMCLHHETDNWPQLLAGSQDGTTVGTTHELHQLTPTGYKGVGNFEAGVPASGDAINDIVVENWSYDILGVKEMQYIFSTTPDIKTDVNTFLTSPTTPVGQANVTSLEGAIRTNLNLLVSGTTTNYQDDEATIKGRTGQFLLHQFRDKLATLTDSTARYRLTNRLGGLFHSNNRNAQGGAVNDYYPFIWQAGDKLVFGVNFTHSDVNLGTLTDSTSDKTLSNLPFKFTVELV